MCTVAFDSMKYQGLYESNLCSNNTTIHTLHLSQCCGRRSGGVVVVGKQRTLVKVLVIPCVGHCHVRGKKVTLDIGAHGALFETTISEIRLVLGSCGRWSGGVAVIVGKQRTIIKVLVVHCIGHSHAVVK